MLVVFVARFFVSFLVTFLRVADSDACRELSLVLLHELFDAAQIEALDDLWVDHPKLVHLHAANLRSTVSLRLHLA